MSLVGVTLTNGSGTIAATGVITSPGTAFAGEILIGGEQLGPSNPVPVSSDAPAAYLSQASILATASVPTASTTIVAANTCSRVLTIWTAPGSTGNVWLNPAGGAAVVGQGALISQGGGSFTFDPVPTAAITAISDNGTVTISAIGS